MLQPLTPILHKYDPLGWQVTPMAEQSLPNASTGHQELSLRAACRADETGALTTAHLAPTWVAFVAEFTWKKYIPKSTRPRDIIRNNGRTIANSTRAAPPASRQSLPPDVWLLMFHHERERS